MTNRASLTAQLWAYKNHLAARVQLASERADNVAEASWAYEQATARTQTPAEDERVNRFCKLATRMADRVTALRAQSVDVASLIESLTDTVI